MFKVNKFIYNSLLKWFLCIWVFCYKLFFFYWDFFIVYLFYIIYFLKFSKLMGIYGKSCIYVLEGKEMCNV